MDFDTSSYLGGLGLGMFTWFSTWLAHKGIQFFKSIWR